MIARHADHIGSLLRPSELISAREDAASGRISRARFKAIEDRAVENAIGLQESVGLPVITDGEQRRLSFQSQFAEAVSGLGEWDLNAFLWGHWRGDAATVGDRTIERPHLEPIDALASRIREASRFVPLERLAVSPQCGFSNSVMGCAITPADQERKLGRVVETARRVWGEDPALLPDIA